MKAQVATEPAEMVLAQRLAEELERVLAGLEPHFRRRETHEVASSYVKALLSRAEWVSSSPTKRLEATH